MQRKRCLLYTSSDFEEMDKFLNRVMGGERKLRWMQLDNAAKIYPAARRRNWNNLFRLSATPVSYTHLIVMISEVLTDESGNTADYLICSNTGDLCDFPAGAYFYTYQQLIKIHGWN